MQVPTSMQVAVAPVTKQSTAIMGTNPVNVVWPRVLAAILVSIWFSSRLVGVFSATTYHEMWQAS